MIEVQDGQYYADRARGGHTMVSNVASGVDTLETHEFYNDNGKVIYYWKVKKDIDGNILDFRIKIPKKPEDPAVAYVNFDDLA